MEMRWKGWFCFLNFKSSIFLPSKGIFLKFTSSLTHKAKGHKNGLVSLYKDMEACGGYQDIQVMWEMIHSSPPPLNAQTIKTSNKPPSWRFCFTTA